MCIAQLIKSLKNCPILLAYCLMLSPAYYAQNYASIFGASLLYSHFCDENSAFCLYFPEALFNTTIKQGFK